MKHALIVVLTLWVGLATNAALAEECDDVTAAKLNSQTKDELQRLDLSPQVDSSEHGQIEELKRRFAEASDLHTLAIDRKNDDDLKKACEAYRSIYDEAKEIGE